MSTSARTSRQGNKKAALEHCGEPVEKKTKAGLRAIKRLTGGGDYKLKDNIVYFKAEAEAHGTGEGF